MAAILHVLLNGALDAAREFTLSSILRRLGYAPIPGRTFHSSPTEESNIGLLSSIHDDESRGEPPKFTPDLDQHCTAFVDRSTSTGKERVSTAAPIFPDGDPVVIIALDEDQTPCFSISATRRLRVICNEAAEARSNLEVKKADLFQLEQQLIEKDSVLARERSSSHSHRSNETSQASKHSRHRNGLSHEVRKIRQRIDSCRKTVEAFERNLSSCRAEVFELIESALRAAQLLKPVEPKHETETQVDDACERSTSKVPSSDKEDIYNFELSEAARAKTRALRYLNEAKEQLFVAQIHFDKRELYEKEELDVYKEAVEQGKAEMTRSEHDVDALICSWQLTRELIKAEQAYNEAKENAEKAGAFEDDCDSLSESDWDCGLGSEDQKKLPSGLNADQVDPNDFEDPISDEDIKRVESWVCRIDEEADPEALRTMEDTHQDEWEYREPQISESLSMVDYGPIGQQIGQWQMMCEEQRQQWREDYPIGNPREKYGHPLKRCMSF